MRELQYRWRIENYERYREYENSLNRTEKYTLRKRINNEKRRCLIN